MRFNQTRQERRNHVQRLRHNRRHYWGYPNRNRVSPGDLPMAPQEMDACQLGKVVNNPQLCSCSGCGNPRRHSWFKGEMLTLQERRFLKQYKEQLDESTEDVEGRQS